MEASSHDRGMRIFHKQLSYKKIGPEIYTELIHKAKKKKKNTDNVFLYLPIYRLNL